LSRLGNKAGRRGTERQDQVCASNPVGGRWTFPQHRGTGPLGRKTVFCQAGDFLPHAPPSRSGPPSPNVVKLPRSSMVPCRRRSQITATAAGPRPPGGVSSARPSKKAGFARCTGARPLFGLTVPLFRWLWSLVVSRNLSSNGDEPLRPAGPAPDVNQSAAARTLSERRPLASTLRGEWAG